jgi:hypothetical protein
MLACLALFSSLWLPTAALADEQGTFLRGSVRAQDYLRPSAGPSLKRQDIKRGGDAFGGDEPAASSPINQEFDPGTGDFDVPHTQMPMPPPPPRNFNLRANMGGNPDFDGASIPGMPDQSTAMMPRQPAFSMVPPPAVPTNLRSADPDSSPEMQLAWDAWHRRVAEAIYERYNAMAQLAFRYSRPLAAYVSYTVTRDNRIVNVQLQQKSPNIAFNVLILAVVNSISGQRDILAFPPGSRRMTVDKGGMFTQNYGQQGFKYVTGDRETIRPH